MVHSQISSSIRVIQIFRSKWRRHSHCGNSGSDCCEKLLLSRWMFWSLPQKPVVVTQEAPRYRLRSFVFSLVADLPSGRRQFHTYGIGCAVRRTSRTSNGVIEDCGGDYATFSFSLTTIRDVVWTLTISMMRTSVNCIGT